MTDEIAVLWRSGQDVAAWRSHEGEVICMACFARIDPRPGGWHARLTFARGLSRCPQCRKKFSRKTSCDACRNVGGIVSR